MTQTLFSLCASAADKAAQVLAEVVPALPAIKSLFEKARGLASEDTDMAGELQAAVDKCVPLCAVHAT